jgi:hypothetical protein
MGRLHIGSLLILVGCSSAAPTADGSGDQAVETGSRWRSHLADGFYDGVDAYGHTAILRLWSTNTTQYFDAAWENDQSSGCSGAVDVSLTGSVTLDGRPSCKYEVTSSADTTTLTDSVGTTSKLKARATNALSRSYATDGGATIEIMTSDTVGLTLSFRDADGTQLFQDAAAWGDPTSWDMGSSLGPRYFAPFSAPFAVASGCHVALYVDQYQGRYALSLWSPDAFCVPDALQGVYVPR